MGNIKFRYWFLLLFFSWFKLVQPLYSQKTSTSTHPYDTNTAKYFVQKADSLLKQNAYDSSIYYFLKAGDIFEQASMWDNVAHCRIWASYAYMDLNKLDLGLENINEGINILKKASQPNNLGIHECTNIKAEIYYYLSKYDKSLQTLETATSITPPMSKEKRPRYERLLAKSYFQFGNSYAGKGNIHSALEMYEKSLEIRKRHFEEDHFLIGDCYNNIGIMYIYLRDYDKAIRNVLRSTAIRENHFGSDHPMTAWSYNNLGGLYESNHNLEGALKYHFKALEVRKKILPEGHRDFGASYMNIANVYNRTGDFSAALKYHFKAINHYHEIFGDSCIELVSIYNNVGDAYFKQEKVDDALNFYKKSEETLSRLNLKIYGTYSLISHNLAEAYFYKELMDSARLRINEVFRASNYYFKKPVNLDAVSRVDLLINAITLKGKIHLFDYNKNLNLSDLRLSVATYLEALNILEKLRYSFLAEGSKLFLSEKSSDIFNEAIDVIHRLYVETKADSLVQLLFQVIERSKTNVLREMLDKSTATDFSGIPDSLVAKENQLSSEIHSCKVDVDLLLEKDDSIYKENITILQNQLFSLENEYEKLINNFDINYPRYTELKYSPKIPSISSFSKNLDDSTGFVNYFISDTSLYIFFIGKDKYGCYQIEVDSSFETMVLNYLRCIKKNRRDEFVKYSGLLYEKLLKPIEHMIVDKQSLVFIPDKYLSYLPFETLCSKTAINQSWTNSLNFLVRRFNIHYHYSVALLQQMTKYKSDKLSTNGGIVGFAPVFSKEGKNNIVASNRSSVIDSTIMDKSVIQAVATNGETYNELPYSKEEVQSIMEIFSNKGYLSDGHFHQGASEEKFKKLAGKYKYIHLATHGFINEKNPHLSGIVFAQSSTSNTSNEEDNILFSGETFNLSLSADLLVLSACETGLGKIVKGEGVMSMTRGFLYAGVSNIIISLWKIGDKNTSDLMEKFYSFQLEGDSYAMALRKAKLELINKNATSFPSTWAGFTLLGVN